MLSAIVGRVTHTIGGPIAIEFGGLIDAIVVSLAIAASVIDRISGNK